MRRRKQQAGFSILEIVVVVAILGILSSIAVPLYAKSAARARRTEATVAFAEIWRAQKAFFSSHDRYGDFDEIGFEAETRVSSTVVRGDRYVFQISQPWGNKSFYCVATGDIDGDAFPDVLVLQAGQP